MSDRFRAMVYLSLFISKQCIIKKIIRFGFCDIRNNHGLGKRYQPRPSAWLITLSEIVIIPDIIKASSNNCLVFCYLNHGLSKITLFALSFSF